MERGNLRQTVSESFEPLDDTESFDVRAIVGIFNSNLITYYFSQFLATGTLQGSYSSIYPDDIRKIPIHNALSDNNNLVADLRFSQRDNETSKRQKFA
ncbi:hypothetical protein D8S78_13915 [Natrialba swarupiae]|nr:hypothetical protein [Natrialba swarupiae]